MTLPDCLDKVQTCVCCKSGLDAVCKCPNNGDSLNDDCDNDGKYHGGKFYLLDSIVLNNNEWNE